ncbi:AAA family ATPase [Helcococcus massiliensis]|uniref:AAA family ATPase n=1 Tax=Helcococcus massiliensis TaxID=2040290 RepID=UPI000CDF10E9|nr:ATP-dependent Clp protease ATP-binding subunit [Helcococcus massiliensis]
MNKELQFNFSRQCLETLQNAKKNVEEVGKTVIESQDILLAGLQTYDTGMSYALAKYSIVASDIKNIIEKSIIVKDKTIYSSMMRPTNPGAKRFNSKYQNPVEFIVEPIADEKLEIFGDSNVSKFVFDAIKYGDEMSRSNPEIYHIDTRYLLIHFSDVNNSNACEIIEYLLTKIDILYEPLTRGFFRRNISLFSMQIDGSAENNKKEEERRANRFHNKIKDPSYSMLEELAVDITEKARLGQLQKVIGRDQEIEQIELVLSRRDKNNVALLGPGGVGKSAIAEGLAIKIANGDLPSLENMKILQFNMNDFSSFSDVYSGEAIKRFAEEMKKQRDVILFIDEIHLLGRYKYFTDTLKPLMARGDFRLIGATTHAEWNYYINSDQALTRRFEIVNVKEPKKEDAIKIIENVSILYENFYRVNYLPEAIEAAVILSNKYLPGLVLPDSALTVLDNAGARVKLQDQGQNYINEKYIDKYRELKDRLEKAQSIKFNEAEVKQIQEELNSLYEVLNKDRNSDHRHDYPIKVSAVDIENEISIKSGRKVSINDKNKDKKLKLKNLKEILSSKVIGQKEATDAVADTLLISKLGFAYPNKPLNSFLFVGPTGVGKTETAKVLSEQVSGSLEDLVRFDMSEYQQAHEVSKLIGAPPGYIGYGTGGLLTEAVKRNKEAVVLFDEIEKAHPKIFDILLQVLDGGRLTDSSGEVVDFSKCIIILTSNLGTKKIGQDKMMGFSDGQSQVDKEAENEKITMEAISEFFRSELINRIDKIITFKSFTFEDILKISKILADKETDLLKTAGLDIQFTDQAIELIAKKYHSAKFGARPIRRGISEMIKGPLAEKIVNDEITKDMPITIDVKDGEIVFVQ